MELTQSLLKELLDYDPLTGAFRWRKRTGRMRAGSIAGTTGGNGYRIIPIFHYFNRMKERKLYPAHRLAILYTDGELNSDMEVDHINGKRDDNRRENLRVCSRGENSRNRRTTHGASKFKGVYAHGNGFMAAVCADGQRYRMGPFESEESAAMAYDNAAVRLHGEFACTNSDLGLL